MSVATDSTNSANARLVTPQELVLLMWPEQAVGVVLGRRHYTCSGREEAEKYTSLSRVQTMSK